MNKLYNDIFADNNLFLFLSTCGTILSDSLTVKTILDVIGGNENANDY